MVNQATDEDNLVAGVSLYTPRHWLFRLDVLPFVLIYAAGFVFCKGGSILGGVDYAYYRYMGLIGVPVGLSIHLVLFLLSQWSASIRCPIGNVPAKKIDDALLAHVTAAKNAGADKLVKVNRLTKEQFSVVKDGFDMFGKTFRIAQHYLEFQKITFDYDTDSKTFVRMVYPTCAALSHYLLWQGHRTEKAVALSDFKYGSNEFDIPLPSFLDLYVTHLTAPFFVFQVICLFLW